MLPPGDRGAVDRLDDDLTPDPTIRNPRATGDPEDEAVDRNSKPVGLSVSDSWR